MIVNILIRDTSLSIFISSVKKSKKCIHSSSFLKQNLLPYKVLHTFSSYLYIYIHIKFNLPLCLLNPFLHFFIKNVRSDQGFFRSIVISEEKKRHQLLLSPFSVWTNSHNQDNRNKKRFLFEPTIRGFSFRGLLVSKDIMPFIFFAILASFQSKFKFKRKWTCLKEEMTFFDTRKKVAKVEILYSETLWLTEIGRSERLSVRGQRLEQW